MRRYVGVRAGARHVQPGGVDVRAGGVGRAAQRHLQRHRLAAAAAHPPRGPRAPPGRICRRGQRAHPRGQGRGRRDAGHGRRRLCRLPAALRLAPHGRRSALAAGAVAGAGREHPGGPLPAAGAAAGGRDAEPRP